MIRAPVSVQPALVVRLQPVPVVSAPVSVQPAPVVRVQPAPVIHVPINAQLTASQIGESRETVTFGPAPVKPRPIDIPQRCAPREISSQGQ